MRLLLVPILLLVSIGLALLFWRDRGDNRRYCTHCGVVARPKNKQGGSGCMEIALWLLFLIPGLLYSIWRASAGGKVCPACGAPHPISLTSPVAERTLRDSGRLAELAPQKDPGLSIARKIGLGIIGLLIVFFTIPTIIMGVMEVRHPGLLSSSGAADSLAAIRFKQAIVDLADWKSSGAVLSWHVVKAGWDGEINLTVGSRFAGLTKEQKESIAESAAQMSDAGRMPGKVTLLDASGRKVGAYREDRGLRME